MGDMSEYVLQHRESIRTDVHREHGNLNESLNLNQNLNLSLDQSLDRSNELSFAENGNPDEALLESLGQEVLSDATRSKDSFEMTAVKQEIRKLQGLLSGDTSPAALLRQYDWVIYVCEEQYLAGKRQNSAYRERHEKVRRFVSQCKTRRRLLLEEHPEAGGETYRKQEHRENRRIALDVRKDKETGFRHDMDTLERAVRETADGEARKKKREAADYEREKLILKRKWRIVISSLLWPLRWKANRGLSKTTWWITETER